jgi:spore coat protein JB
MDDMSMSVNMNMSMDREKMLEKVMEADFYCFDLGLFLNTHPTDKEALAVFNKSMEKAKEMREKFEKLYGPLTHAGVNDPDYFTWIEEPWNWEKSKNNLMMRGEK